MSFNWLKMIVFICCVLSWVSWYFVVQLIDPVKTNFLGFTIFYFGLFTSLFFSFTFLFTIFRHWKNSEQIIYKMVLVSIRHAFLFSFLLIFALYFSHVELLTITTWIVLIIIFTVIEFIFLKKK